MKKHTSVDLINFTKSITVCSTHMFYWAIPVQGQQADYLTTTTIQFREHFKGPSFGKQVPMSKGGLVSTYKSKAYLT